MYACVQEYTGKGEVLYASLTFPFSIAPCLDNPSSLQLRSDWACVHCPQRAVNFLTTAHPSTPTLDLAIVHEIEPVP